MTYSPRSLLLSALMLAVLSPVLFAAVAQDTPPEEMTVIVFRSGQQVRGEIIDTIPPTGEPEWIVFRTESGLRTRYNIALIQEIIRPEDRDSEASTRLLTDLRNALIRGTYLTDPSGSMESLGRLYSLASQSNDSVFVSEVEDLRWNICEGIFNLAQRRTDEALRLRQSGGDWIDAVDSAFQCWDPLDNFLLDSRTELRPANPQSPADLAFHTDQYIPALTRALQVRVEALLHRATESRPPDRTLLGSARDYNQQLGSLTGNAFGSQYNSILIYEAGGEYSVALELATNLLAELRNTPGVSLTQIDMLQVKVGSLEMLAAQQPTEGPQTITDVLQESRPTPPRPDVAQAPTPTQPRPQPTGPSISRPQPTVPGAPSIARDPREQSGSGGSFWNRFTRSFTNRNWGAMFSTFKNWLTAPGNKTVQWGVVAIVLFLVFWVIPYKITKMFAGRGSVSASIWAPRVKRFGLLGIFGWILSPVGRVVTGGRRKRRAKGGDGENLCPHCGGDLTDLDLYRDLNFLICPHCRESITPIYDLSDYIRHLVGQMDSVRRGKQLGADLSNKVEREAMLKLTRAIMTLTVRRRASDLHIEASGDGLDLRIRVDGVLAPLDIHIPQAVERACVSAIKVMSNLDITERRVPQDGRFDITIDGAKIDVRINTSPTGLGEKIAMRLLDVRNVEVPVEKLGFGEDKLPIFRHAITSSHGLMLVTGPTGSGKSTTLYVALNEINNGSRNIITLEDPIEYIFKGLNQHQVNPAAHFTFATGLRSIIRQDPDVIMVGEIRDRETADIAVDAATTGHLVMTTLHTIDAAGAYQRLTEIGLDPHRFAPTMLLVLAQRLMRLLCSSCKEPGEPIFDMMEKLDIASAEGMSLYQPVGCERCLSMGYRGRTGIFEVMSINDEMRTLMEGHSPISVIRETARKFGMRTLREEAVIRIRDGLSSLEEGMRIVG